MASTSSREKGKGLEKREEEQDEGRKRDYKDTHVKLDYEFIDRLKNLKEWPEMEPPVEKPEGTLTEEQIQEMSRKTFDFDYVLKNRLLDEEIVWEDDVGALQHNTATSEAHAKKADNN